MPALLPEKYCNDVHERLVLYKRLASAETMDELEGIQEELVDRFGPTPEQAQALLACHRLRLLAKPLGVRKIDAGPERTTLQFVKHPPFDTGRADPARAEGRAHPLRRTRSHPHRARGADAGGAHRAGEGFPGQVGVAGNVSTAVQAASSQEARWRLRRR